MLSKQVGVDGVNIHGGVFAGQFLFPCLAMETEPTEARVDAYESFTYFWTRIFVEPHSKKQRKQGSKRWSALLRLLAAACMI